MISLFKLIFNLLKYILVIGGILSIIIGGFTGLYFYNRLTRDLPRIEKLSDYKPKAVSAIYSSNGTKLSEIWDERRYPVALEQIPPHVKNAFLAAEDSSFYAHGGIDFLSIIRAAWVNLTSRGTKQGASTITQQIVKELLLSRERTYERKLKEAILSYRLEKHLSKDDILSIYLNQIFLGSGAYGIKAAAKVHFHKELEELSIAQAALLGALPKKPSELTRPKNLDMAIRRQRYVLRQMFEKGFISENEYEASLKEEIKLFPQDEENLFASPYFTTHAIKEAEKAIQKINPEYTLREPGGFSVYTSVDVDSDLNAQNSLKKGLKSLDKRHGWRQPIGNIRDTSENINENSSKWDEIGSVNEINPNKIYRALVTSKDTRNEIVKVKLGEIEADINLKNSTWAKTFCKLEPGSPEIKSWFGGSPVNVITPGDIIEVSIAKIAKDDSGNITSYEFQLDQTPAVQGAMVVMNSSTGEVISLVGGFDYKKSKFNRATQGELQPGSSFKPLIYLSALEELKMTASTLVPDEPIQYETLNGIWAPRNFDNKFLGPITLRVALQKSRNVVSVYLVQRIGVDKIIASARRLGIESPIPRNLSIALGTPEVKVLEMVRSYAPFSSGGYLPETIIIQSIKDREGEVLFQAFPNQKQVIKPQEAFIIANMMKGVIERGTAQVLRKLEKPIGGKTGTTNNHMDAWFIGFTPEWVAGVWVGFDAKRSLGKTATGGGVAAPIMLDFLEQFLKDSPAIDFTPPEGVSPVRVDPESGLPVDSSSEKSIIEYFIEGDSADAKDWLNRYHGSYIPRSNEGGDYLTNTDF